MCIPSLPSVFLALVSTRYEGSSHALSTAKFSIFIQHIPSSIPFSTFLDIICRLFISKVPQPIPYSLPSQFVSVDCLFPRVRLEFPIGRPKMSSTLLNLLQIIDIKPTSADSLEHSFTSFPFSSVNLSIIV